MQIDLRPAWILLGFVALIFAGCATRDEGVEIEPLPPSDGAPAGGISPGPGLVERGDTLELFVREDPTFDGEYLVREKGDIIIPEVGRIPIAGLSIEGAENRIKDALETAQLTSASVIVDRISSRPASPERADESEVTMIFLSGKVNRPGRHAVPMYQGRRPGIHEAILICGGLGRFADERKISLLRPDGENGEKRRYVVNLSKIKLGEAEDFPISEGDILVVPEKSISL